MAQAIGTFDTGHSGPVHDTQLDYYGRRLATASSDHTIRIFDVSTDQPTFLVELKGHEGPVWQVCWAHPTFGSVLASCSYDKRVIVWKEIHRGHWEAVYSCDDFTSSVNGISWCPWEYGLQFACAVADGTVAVCSYNSEIRNWTKKHVFGHPNGANAVSWAPAINNTTISASQQVIRLVSGGCDNKIRIWKQDPQTGELADIGHTLDVAHTEWVRDVAWRPCVGLLTDTIVSCGDDKTAVIWTQDADVQGWRSMQVLNFNSPVWRVSWSVTGTILAISSGEDIVTLFKENSDGHWEVLTKISNHSEKPNISVETDSFFGEVSNIQSTETSSQQFIRQTGVSNIGHPNMGDSVGIEAVPFEDQFRRSTANQPTPSMYVSPSPPSMSNSLVHPLATSPTPSSVSHPTSMIPPTTMSSTAPIPSSQALPITSIPPPHTPLLPSSNSMPPPSSNSIPPPSSNSIPPPSSNSIPPPSSNSIPPPSSNSIPPPSSNSIPPPSSNSIPPPSSNSIPPPPPPPPISMPLPSALQITQKHMSTPSSMASAVPPPHPITNSASSPSNPSFMQVTNSKTSLVTPLGMPPIPPRSTTIPSSSSISGMGPNNIQNQTTSNSSPVMPPPPPPLSHVGMPPSVTAPPPPGIRRYPGIQ
ncbi:uncharacterized protein CMU_005520 [Cryptosporidium muris RN66]|uniref:Uncharacterized protein n=1 Tax=Cryptosporidium muris (strain RN66) TaxID=441375 RepID=B6AHD4_CRYMR|nr:uncharacterized protein CMU_005520 [Cryptosporidium muris RN66]EEA07629.1 hypothetical protein, conserved [Cryptosporidium muris RN66]|eukprot:XP_002141978.1 hypothetical protein [Cryptosporidium muris RN66]